MKAPLQFTVLGGRIHRERIVNSSGFTSTATHKFVVPAGKRWYLLNGHARPDTSTTVVAVKYNAADEKLADLMATAANTVYNYFPETRTGESFSIPYGLPVTLIAGDYILITFGVAQGAAAIVFIEVIEVDI